MLRGRLTTLPPQPPTIIGDIIGATVASILLAVGIPNGRNDDGIAILKFLVQARKSVFVACC